MVRKLDDALGLSDMAQAALDDSHQTVGVVGGYHGSLEPKRSRVGRLTNDRQYRNPRPPSGSGR